MKIRIKKIVGYGLGFENLTPGSEHEVLAEIKIFGQRVFRVKGVGDNVVVYESECEIIEE